MAPLGLAYLLLLLTVLRRAAGGSSPDSTNCELTTGRTLTVIKSVRFPEPYGPNVNCRYTVRRRSSSICSVTFLFNVLDLDPSPGCTADYLSFEGTGEKLCGAKPVGFTRTISFVDSKNEVVMTFHSGNGSHGGLGYMITVVQQECPRPSCNSIHEEEEFSLSSPNYPLPYENGQSCRYTIHKVDPRICRLSLVVHSFELEEDEHCMSDFLQLSDGNKLCGTLKPGQIVEVPFPNATATFEFQSDHVMTQNGFQIVAHQVECNTILEAKDDFSSTTSNTLSTETTTPMDNGTINTLPEVITPLP